jgi:hypothetical protein
MRYFLRAYLVAALWSETQDNGRPLDDDFAIADLDADATALANRVCVDFERKAEPLLTAIEPFQPQRAFSSDEQNGHDFG